MKIHFIGIGGIGVSAVAQYFLAQGNQVYGSDLVSSEITRMLEKKGIKIFIGPNDPKNIEKIFPDIVAYSPAVLPDNPELLKAKELNIVCKSSPELLGEITKEKYTIAICGSHGKSTTASMIALMLKDAGLDPTAIIGTKLEEFEDSNFRFGKSPYLVIEADEYKRSFLNHWPKIIVLTNLEIDHLDYFKDMQDLISAYKEFIAKLPENGYLILNNSAPKDFDQKNSIRYSSQIKMNLSVPGKYNLENANAALEVAKILQIPEKTAISSLEKYKGAWRRLEEKELEINGKKIIMISDYGHHPTQLIATVSAIREKYPDKIITCVYQPHQYKRTLFFYNEFVENIKKCQKLADDFILTDIYDVAGREDQEAKQKVSSQKLADDSGAKYVSKQEIRDYLIGILKDDQVLLIMSAGDFYTL
ncbi:MAG TPA: Mur ligase domain-containing protein [Candidatus Pacearchaeota archaeon]|nr:Mur ligase domain-containing protein [Candidatus Pacearchaeota archaeon]HPM08616.1 Mur ligase domain-containing protein [Candidatus Pacearchaeota archaeon]HQI74786.1 Mur ligase domain-containing protein [Candidatus Pacearchaeota archaeon]